MLHAKYLGFEHPRDNRFVEFDSELPEYFQKTLNSLENKEKAISVINDILKDIEKKG